MTFQSVVLTTPQPTADDPAHVEAMIAKVDASAAAVSGAGADPAIEAAAERPEWLPEKFKSPAEMAKAYAELEAKQSGAKAADPATPPADAAKDPEANPEADAAKTAAEAAGIPFDTYAAEFAEKGALSEDTYKALEAKGIDKATVDTFIEGQKAIQERYEADIRSAANGRFDEMVEWAKANLSDAEKRAADEAINTHDPVKAKLAVSGLYQRFTEASPDEPNLVTAGSGKATGDVYESNAQMTADMRDPRYKTDPAFRAKVAAKVGRSKLS